MENIKKGFWRKSCLFVDSLNFWTANIFCYISVVLMLLVSYEVICRYLLNSPSDWSGEINQYLLCVMSMLGGGYALLIDQHVRVDIIYRFFSPKRRSIAELATWWLVILFALTLLWFGGENAMDALIKGKKSMSIMEMPLFPSLIMVPIGALLILLQALARMVRCILTLTTGIDEVAREKSAA
ncbi:MAG: TRAP transporter small permease [Desulfobacteraceae bacterium]|jgi:TRAP-type mannitol/chloroaromatic compound transport system permease small subunit|nr:MAG: TRAP transporter small permease [Desulfobacteraceae bacterium]